MIKNVLQEVGGIGVYALISLLLFFAVFTGALIFTFIQRASLCRKMESLPLEDERSSETRKEQTNL
jgi:hypothetical protein